MEHASSDQLSHLAPPLAPLWAARPMRNLRNKGMRDVGGMPEGFVGARRARDAAPCNYVFEHQRRRAELLDVAQELGQLKSAESTSVRHAEGEGGDEALTAVEGNSGLVSVTRVVGCVRCVVLYLCVIQMSVIRMYDASDGRSCSFQRMSESSTDAQQSADDRWQCESSYVKYMHGVLSFRSVHSACTTLSFMSSMNLRPNQSCRPVFGEIWVLSV